MLAVDSATLRISRESRPSSFAARNAFGASRFTVSVLPNRSRVVCVSVRRAIRFSAALATINAS